MVLSYKLIFIGMGIWARYVPLGATCCIAIAIFMEQSWGLLFYTLFGAADGAVAISIHFAVV